MRPIDSSPKVTFICPVSGRDFGQRGGSNWFDPDEKPEKWDKEEQFKNIQQEFI